MQHARMHPATFFLTDAESFDGTHALADHITHTETECEPNLALRIRWSYFPRKSGALCDAASLVVLIW